VREGAPQKTRMDENLCFCCWSLEPTQPIVPIFSELLLSLCKDLQL